jgi:hypothetical protein
MNQELRESACQRMATVLDEIGVFVHVFIINVCINVCISMYMYVY